LLLTPRELIGAGVGLLGNPDRDQVLERLFADALK